MYYCSSKDRRDLDITTERLKVLRVVGEGTAQIVVENEILIDAIKIDKIDARITDTEDHVFHNKVVKQGIIHKQIFYVDRNNFVRHISEDIPFMVHVDIPGVTPNDSVEIQNHLLDIDVDYQLVPDMNHHTPAWNPCPGVGDIPIMPTPTPLPPAMMVLRQKVVAHVLVRVSEWSLRNVVTDVKYPSRVYTVCSKTTRCIC